MDIDANKVLEILSQDISQYIKTIAILRVQLEALQKENEELKEEDGE